MAHFGALFLQRTDYEAMTFFLPPGNDFYLRATNKFKKTTARTMNWD
jgi:hypothetical protein